MYQDFPGNFDTSSRGSSGSPGHPESYSSVTATQQVGEVILAAMELLGCASSSAPFHASLWVSDPLGVFCIEMQVLYQDSVRLGR